MRRELNAYDGPYLLKVIDNQGIIGYTKRHDNMSYNEAMEDFIEGEIEFLGDTFLFDVNDVYYDLDADVKEGLLIKIKPGTFESIKEFVKSLNQ